MTRWSFHVHLAAWWGGMLHTCHEAGASASFPPAPFGSLPSPSFINHKYVWKRGDGGGLGRQGEVGKRPGSVKAELWGVRKHFWWENTHTKIFPRLRESFFTGKTFLSSIDKLSCRNMRDFYYLYWMDGWLVEVFLVVFFNIFIMFDDSESMLTWVSLHMFMFMSEVSCH